MRGSVVNPPGFRVSGLGFLWFRVWGLVAKRDLGYQIPVRSVLCPHEVGKVVWCHYSKRAYPHLGHSHSLSPSSVWSEVCIHLILFISAISTAVKEKGLRFRVRV